MKKLDTSLSKLDLFAVYLSYAFRYLYPLVLVPYYGRVLGAGGYGVVLAGTSLSNSLWLFVNFGLSTIGGRELVQSDQAGHQDVIFREHFTARLVIATPAAVIGLIAAFRSDVISSVPYAPFFIVAGGILAAFNLGWYFSCTGRVRTNMAIEVMGLALSLIVLFAFIHKPTDVGLVFPLTFASGLLQTGLSYWLVRKESTGFLVSLRAAFAVIKRTTTIFLYNGTATLMLSASAYILSLMASPVEVGAFGISERLIAAALGVMAPAGQVLAPKVMYLVAHDEAKANWFARRIFAVFLIGAIAGVVLTRTLSDWLVPLAFGPEFRAAVPILNLMVFVLPISVCTRVLGLYFVLPRKLERLLLWTGIASAVVNLLVAIPLASYRGAEGMAEARLIGETALLAMLIFGVSRAGLLRGFIGMGNAVSLNARLARWRE
ncbi:oligosaccharide flippase family protein [Paraburkholderia tropica]|jgi:O-antigen/teichoic acid export membrane protein|uniref:oligosaccharide flippase family protein n=1 Tax=Paraburkholderia tropica TaxID=92647 RepID=UPI002AB7BA22|nr:oligosaccharide flippase family protein [Paraburkholderia tropica]